MFHLLLVEVIIVMPSKSVFTKFLPYASAGIPGGMRILTLIFVGFILDDRESARFSSNYTLASAIMLFCGMGVSTILFKYFELKNNLYIIRDALLAVFLWGGGSCYILLWGGSEFFYLDNVGLVWSCSIVFSLYQVLRSFFVYKKRFFILVICDCFQFFSWCCICMVISMRKEYEVSSFVVTLSMVISYIFSGILLLVITFISEDKSDLIIKNRKLLFLDNGFLISSAIIGLSNLFSSGIGLILPTLFYSLGGEQVVLLTSLANSLFSGIAVFPRGLVNNNVAYISSGVLSRKLEYSFVKNLNKIVFYMVVSGLFFVLIFILPYFLVVGKLASLYSIESIFVILFSFSLACAQLGVVEANIVNLCGKENVALWANALIFVSIIAIFMVGTKYGGVAFTIISIPSVLVFLYLLRFFFYKKIIGKYLIIPLSG